MSNSSEGRKPQGSPDSSLEKSKKSEATGSTPLFDYEESSGRSVEDYNVSSTAPPPYGSFSHHQIDAHVSTSHHDSSVPYPHPNIVAGYESLLPGATDRILKMAEKEQEARIAFFNKQEDHQHKAVMKALSNETLGVVLGFIAITGLGIGGAFAISSGKTELGVVLLSLSGAGYIGAAVSAVKSRIRGRGDDVTSGNEGGS